MTARKIAPWIALAALGLAAVAGAQQTLYRWVDKDGKLQYSDIQPNTDAKVTEKALKGGGPDTAAASRTRSATPRATRPRRTCSRKRSATSSSPR